mmetsp:Transcript_5922/g.10723  ORF Transcript_5922/g.10723 Transcript_5922/m.10723 type:complete len:241 (-) Transcript_5922:84-806(-)
MSLVCQVAPGLETDEDLQALYNWVDEIPLSRPKRNISRDFADGVLFAEVVNHFYPRLVEMHNYSSANSHTQKMYNWNTLNTKVLKKLGYQIHQQDLEDVIKAAPGAIERVLAHFQKLIAQGVNRQPKVAAPSRPSVGSIPSKDSAGRAPLPSSIAPSAPQSERGPPRVGLDKDPGPAPRMQKMQLEVDTELLLEKEQAIAELREMVGIMTEKIKKLEQLVRIKDSKIEALTQKLQKHGLA